MRLVIVSGLAGAGKTVALKHFEDFGYYCIDNIPIGLVQPLIAHALAHPEPRYRQLAIVVDARAFPAEIASFPRLVDAVRNQGVEVQMMFLNASDTAILRRFNETRRPHPLAGAEITLREAIALERRLLTPIANLADVPLDTSRMNQHELRAAVQALLPGDRPSQLGLVLLSFGYKNGMIENADYVFDVRCLPNPHWVPDLRALSGRDPPVRNYLDAQPEVATMYADLQAFLGRWLPAFRRQNRRDVTVALGCTGGQHRSVYLVERLALGLADYADTLTIKHRELE